MVLWYGVRRSDLATRITYEVTIRHCRVQSFNKATRVVDLESSNGQSRQRFKPGWTASGAVWRLELDAELLERVFEGRLVAREICSDGIVKQNQLLVHHLHLPRQQTQSVAQTGLQLHITIPPPLPYVLARLRQLDIGSQLMWLHSHHVTTQVVCPLLGN